MDRYICLHGHFYQPPRENPWLEAIELQDSARPFHDWNERICAECYAPNTASRILDPEGQIIDLVNNYSKMSFNFGPTLLSWLEGQAPEVYEAILEADRISQSYFSGHGSAIAQVYNHMIMPLANRRDKSTQVYWAIQDFQKRFQRHPEGMWLPECAVDIETLEVLAEQEIKFTILSPYQAKRIRGQIDPRIPYRCALPSGKTIALFFYDSHVAHDLAFGRLTKNGGLFAERLNGLFSSDPRPELAHVAIDGETYGHHKRYAEMALSYCLHLIESKNLAKLTVYGEYLEKFPPTVEVEIFENSSWSCSHGVERWRADCGCRAGALHRATQAWRAPLREAMDWLQERLAAVFETEAANLLTEPWKARDDYIGVILDRSPDNVRQFLATHATRDLTTEEQGKVLKLLELQRNGQLMFTSCGWFFDEISRIESVQVMEYAARAMQLAAEIGGLDLEPQYVRFLERAPSNVRIYKDGRNVYEKCVVPSRVDLFRVGAHFGVSSLFGSYADQTEIYCYSIQLKRFQKVEENTMRLATGVATITSHITWETSDQFFAVFYLGENNLFCGTRTLPSAAVLEEVEVPLREAFEKGDVTAVIHLMNQHFLANNYSFFHLFKDEQRKLLRALVQSSVNEMDAVFRQIYDSQLPNIRFLRKAQNPLPHPLEAVVNFVLSRDVKRALKEDLPDLPKLKSLFSTLIEFEVDFDKDVFGFLATQKITDLLERLALNPRELHLLEMSVEIVELVNTLSLDLRMWKPQNIFFAIGQQHVVPMREEAEKGDPSAQAWLQSYQRLGKQLDVRPRT